MYRISHVLNTSLKHVYWSYHLWITVIGLDSFVTLLLFDFGTVKVKKLKVRTFIITCCLKGNQNSSGWQFQMAYWPALTVVGTAQLAAAHCPNEQTQPEHCGLHPAVFSGSDSLLYLLYSITCHQQLGDGFVAASRRLVLGRRTSSTSSLSGCWRLTCLGVEIVTHCDYLFKLCLHKFSCLLTIVYLIVRLCTVCDAKLVLKYFADMDRPMDLLSKQLWLILHRTIISVRMEPTIIVTVLRIIEREER